MVLKRLASVGVAGALLLGGTVALAAPASASAASTAFSNCLNPYFNVANQLWGEKDGDLSVAIQYTGYARCYYALSQRTDITDDQEISAINNFNHYYDLASMQIIKVGKSYYNDIMDRWGLKGLNG